MFPDVGNSIGSYLQEAIRLEPGHRAVQSYLELAGTEAPSRDEEIPGAPDAPRDPQAERNLRGRVDHDDQEIQHRMSAGGGVSIVVHGCAFDNVMPFR